MWHEAVWEWICSRSSANRNRRPALTRRQLQCESLEDRLLLTIGAEEQLFVYLLNRARHDPVAYQQEQNLPVSLSDVTPQPPLAVNSALFDSTEFHANDMATRNYFAHTATPPVNLTPNEMATNAGYVLPDFYPVPGNNIESIGAGNVINTAAEVLDLLIVDEGVPSLGHRVHLLAMNDFFADHREIGVGHALDLSSDLDHYWAIHTAFSTSGDKFLTGVVFNDLNSNGRYDLNEGLSGVGVSVTGTPGTTTNAAGGWSVKVSGTPEVTVIASGGTFVGTSTATFTVPADSVEVDFISGNATGIINFADGLAGPPNRAPVLNATAAFKLPTIAEDTADPAGTLLSTLIGTGITDLDAGALRGIAVIATAGAGTWQFSNNSGASWGDFGSANASTALLLPSTYMVRFLPDANASGQASFTFRAWDQTIGNAETTADVSLTSAVGGTTAFSTASRKATITVTAANDAPVLDAQATPAFSTLEDKAGRVTVATLLGTSVTDVDTGALKGMAVIGAGTGGTWQYSVDGGITFRNFGTPADTAARLLRSTDFIRFIPARHSITGSTLTFRAWDRIRGTAGGTADITTLGSGGSNAFSTDQVTATVNITPVNDAPVLLPGKPLLPAVSVGDTDPAGVTVDTLAGTFITDVDGLAEGIAVMGVTGTANGQWQFSTDGGGSFNPVGTVSSLSSLLLGANDLLRFLPNPGYTLTTAASILPTISYRAWDGTAGTTGQTTAISRVGGATAFSLAKQTASVRVNSAPLLTPASPTLPSIAANKVFTSTIATLLGNSVQDVGTATRLGIAVTGLTTTGTGRWQYSVNGGLSFVNFGSPTDATARLLRATDKIRYLPLGSPGTATLTYRAWDQTTSTAGKTIDLSGVLSAQGAFSSATDTASLTVT